MNTCGPVDGFCGAPGPNEHVIFRAYVYARPALLERAHMGNTGTGGLE
jgi:hypothetical protein